MSAKEQAKLAPMVKEATKGAKLSPDALKALVDQIAMQPEEFVKTGNFAKAVNFFAKAWNTARFKKVPADKQNQAQGAEHHQPLILPNGSMTVARYSGPSTNFIKRLREDLSKAGNDPSKVRGLTPVDTIALKHDAAYALAKTAQDVRDADKEMISRVTKVLATGKDSKYNGVGGLAIVGKIIAESAGLLSKGSFADVAHPLPDGPERQLVQQVYDAQDPKVIGYGKEKTKRKATKWNIHVASVRKANPSYSLKKALQEAKKSYKK